MAPSAVNRWRQLAACVGAMMAIANLQYAWTLFTIPLTREFGATLAAVQVAFTLFVLAETWLVPFAWGEIFSLFPATIADVFGPRYASTNYGVQYTAKGLSAIFAAWGAAHIAGIFGSWVPILWAAVVCDLTAVALALFLLKPLVAAGIQRDAWSVSPPAS